MPGRVHAVPDLADERLVVGRREDVVVEDVGHRRRQVAVVPRVRLGVRLLQQEELELGADHRREAEPLRALHLRACSTCRGDGATGEPSCQTHVAEDERRRLEPRDPPERGEIGLHAEVAVAPLPARNRVPRHRIHLHLEREQVVAALDAVAGVELVEEELAVQALPHQPTLHVGEGDDDSVDGAALDVRPQLVDAQHESDPMQSRPAR